MSSPYLYAKHSKVIPVHKGDRVPADGVFIPTDSWKIYSAALKASELKLKACENNCRQRLQDTKDFAELKCSTKLQSTEAILQARLKFKDYELQDIRRGSWRRDLFIGGGGAVIGIVVGLVGGFYLHGLMH
jgi:hypothetical protein